MSSALATRGYVARFTTSSSGPSGILVPFVIYDADGNLAPSLDLSGAGVVQVSVNGGAWSDRAGSAPTEIGDGAYYYQLDSTEAATPGWVLVKVDKATYKVTIERQDIGNPAADVVAALVAYSYRSGRTVLGLLRRLGASVEGKAEGLDGILAKFYEPGGSVVEFEATQDPVLGTRDEVDVTNSETP